MQKENNKKTQKREDFNHNLKQEIGEVQNQYI